MALSRPVNRDVSRSVLGRLAGPKVRLTESLLERPRDWLMEAKLSSCSGRQNRAFRNQFDSQPECVRLIGTFLTFTSMQHSFGTQLSKAGTAPRATQPVLRHRDLKLTMNTKPDDGDSILREPWMVAIIDHQKSRKRRCTKSSPSVSS